MPALLNPILPQQLHAEAEGKRIARALYLRDMMQHVRLRSSTNVPIVCEGYLVIRNYLLNPKLLPAYQHPLLKPIAALVHVINRTIEADGFISAIDNDHYAFRRSTDEAKLRVIEFSAAPYPNAILTALNTIRDSLSPHSDDLDIRMRRLALDEFCNKFEKEIRDENAYRRFDRYIQICLSAVKNTHADPSGSLGLGDTITNLPRAVATTAPVDDPQLVKQGGKFIKELYWRKGTVDPALHHLLQLVADKSKQPDHITSADISNITHYVFMVYRAAKDHAAGVRSRELTYMDRCLQCLAECFVILKASETIPTLAAIKESLGKFCKEEFYLLGDPDVVMADDERAERQARYGAVSKYYEQNVLPVLDEKSASIAAFVTSSFAQIKGTGKA